MLWLVLYTYKNISRNRSKEKSAKWNPINIAHKTQFKLLQHCIVCIYVFIIFIEHNTLTHTGGIDKEWEKAISRLYFYNTIVSRDAYNQKELINLQFYLFYLETPVLFALDSFIIFTNKNCFIGYNCNLLYKHTEIDKS